MKKINAIIILTTIIITLSSFSDKSEIDNIRLVIVNDTLAKINIEGAIAGFPNYIFRFTELKKLEIHQCWYKNLPAELSIFKELDEIELLKCLNFNYDSLSYMLYKNQKIEKLSLIGNSLKYVPPGLSKLKNLKELDLSYNSISLVPSEILQINGLRSIDLRENKVRAFQVDSGNYSIWNLTLNNNELKDIPLGLDKLKGLKVILFDMNPELKLEKICDLVEHLDSLELLSIIGCEVDGIPTNIINLKKIKKMVVSHMQFTKEEIEKMREIGIKLIGTPKQ